MSLPDLASNMSYYDDDDDLPVVVMDYENDTDTTEVMVTEVNDTRRKLLMAGVEDFMQSWEYKVRLIKSLKN